MVLCVWPCFLLKCISDAFFYTSSAANTLRFIKIIDTLLRASEKKKIPVLSLTMYDKAELLDAQLHPEKHQDLIVRVWGFQARFTELDKELQDHIINRIS